MMHFAICDDNELHLDGICRLIRQCASVHNCDVALAPFSSAEALLLAVENQEITVEIAILDISMNGMDGIDLAKRLNKIAPCCQVIFLTGYITYAMDVYETNHVYLVLKEKQNERLWPAVEKAWERYHAIQKDMLAVRSGTATVALHFSEILYLERRVRMTFLQTAQEEVRTSDSLDALAARLPGQFARCHKSFLVNLEYVKRLQNKAFILKDERIIPISRSYRKAAEEQFWRYMNISGADME